MAEMEMVCVESVEAVRVLNACKMFPPDTCVLNGLNMSVTSGTVYGLLGPSGCGKTTLINIILGKLSLDSGFIKVNTDRLSDIGYMPQGLCLDTMLTIRETFEFYGSLYKMDKSNISCKSKELINWLKLPPSDTLLKNLSGGQCRRVSLAVTLLHDPKIIILDEPTVGVDPVLRYEIWQKLLKIVTEQAKTVILTTHYIEEAHQAQTIGLMRNGVLIEEASPQDLLVKQNTTSLEVAFLSLSYSQKFDKVTQKTFQNKRLPPIKLYSNSGVSLSRIRAFLKKNMIICFRDFTFLFFMIIFPMLAAIIFNVAIGGNIKNVNIAVYNKETTNCRNNMVKGCLYNDNEDFTLSCEVLNGLRSLEYNLIDVDDQKAGDILVEKSQSVAFLQFPQNFSKGLQQYVSGTWLSDDEDSTKFAYANIDVGNFLVKSQVIRSIINVFEKVIVNNTRSCSEKFYINSFKTIHLVGDKVEKFIHCIATMFVSMIGFYFSSVISTGFMLTEKTEGFLDRSMTAGITILEVIISITCIQTVLHFIQTTSVVIVTYFVFNNPIEITTGLIAYMFIIFLTGWLGLLYGLLIVGISKSSNEAMHMVIGWNMMQIYLSGIMWPIEAQWPLIKTFSEHLPLCYISRLLNNIVLRGWTISHPAVLTGTAIVIAYVFLHVLLLLYLTRIKKDAWLINKI